VVMIGIFLKIALTSNLFKGDTMWQTLGSFVLSAVTKLFRKQFLQALNQLIDELQEKYLENTNQLKENLLTQDYLGDRNIVSNRQIREAVTQAQNSFNIGLDSKGNISSGLQIKF